MNILTHLFGKKKATAAAISAEIERTTAELATIQDQLSHVMDGLAVMDDEQHQAAEAKNAAFRRAIDRLDARLVALHVEHAAALATEAEAEKQAEAARFRARTEAARNAVEIEGADLLEKYDNLARQMADTLARLEEIDTEAKECRVSGITQTYRKHPDRPASERREKRQCWVFRYPASPPDTANLKFVQEAAREEVVQATINPDTGKAIPVGSELYNHFGRILTIVPVLEEREIVVSRTGFRHGHYESPLPEFLAPGFAGGAAHWPRKR